MMLPFIVDFTNLLLGSLLVGAMFCVCLVFNPAHLDAAHYITMQQQGIRTLHPVMPRLGALTIATTIAAAVLARTDRMRFVLLAATAILFLVSGLITRFANQPINAIVNGWNTTAPPDQWTNLRDLWWRWHWVRTGSGLAGLILLILATLARRPSLMEGPPTLAIGRSLLGALIRLGSLLI